MAYILTDHGTLDIVAPVATTRATDEVELFICSCGAASTYSDRPFYYLVASWRGPYRNGRDNPDAIVWPTAASKQLWCELDATCGPPIWSDISAWDRAQAAVLKRNYKRAIAWRDKNP